ncbi:MAG: glutamate--tRNA ligase [Bacteroidetes bacterium]|nr:glutamate--tRNA ligase [Bacteroidota bacterium]
MTNRVRVRFAPSPTGPLHIGGVRTALFNYLFSKKQQGEFLLRIEDTNHNRFVPGTEEYIIESLEWLGISYDEGPGKEKEAGPYRQSERKNRYRAYAEKLIQSGAAYYAFDSQETLDQLRKEKESQGETFSYNWENRNRLSNSLVLSEQEVQKKLDLGAPFVIRFKSPENEQLILNDLIRGEIKVDSAILDDKILFKSDGMPTYHLANIVDDHLMKISHVIRGEEWLPSLPLHYLLYRAFGWEAPKFAHLPLILKPSGHGKLSKRDGDKLGFPVFPLEWKSESGEISSGYRENGYLPEAVINMLAFLGWNPGTEQELFSLEELIENFDLRKVNKSGAKFDPDKTKWFQNQYFQKLSTDEITIHFKEYLEKEKIDYTVDVHKIVILLKERATFISDLWEQGSFFFQTPSAYDQKAIDKTVKPETAAYLTRVKELIASVNEFSSENLSAVIKGWISEEKIGFGKVMMPLRLALVGEMKGPDVMDILSVLGKKESLKRIENLIDKIK